MFQPPASEAERDRVQALLAQRLEAEEEVLVAYLHGSFLETMYQDIDVAVLFSSDVEDPLRRSLRLTEALTRALDAGVEVDVRGLNDAPLPFRFEVLRKGRLLFSRDEEARVSLETRTIRGFHDFQHHLRTYGRGIRGART